MVFFFRIEAVVLLIRFYCMWQFHLKPPLIYWLGLGSYHRVASILGLHYEICNNFKKVPKIRYRHACHSSDSCKILKVCIRMMQSNICTPSPDGYRLRVGIKWSLPLFRLLTRFLIVEPFRIFQYLPEILKLYMFIHRFLYIFNISFRNVLIYQFVTFEILLKKWKDQCADEGTCRWGSKW
jgi:hypothetical protein